MADNDVFVYAINGLNTLDEITANLENFKLEAVRALNKVARDSRAEAARRILDQVAFERSYLNPANKRLYVKKQAQQTSLEAVIQARGRPTSLARFIVGGGHAGQEGVTVRVHRSQFLKGAFLMKLRAGKADIETKFNLGLAVRLKPGKTLRNKRYFTQVASGLYLLYGPSVSQVFLDNQEQGVAVDMESDILDSLETEMLRLIGVKNG